MPFYIPNKARDWFKHIRGGKDGFKIDFDIYYFCLMAGLAKPRKIALPYGETTEITQSFPKDYQANRHLIVALFLKTELDNLGISLQERKVLDAQLKRLVDPISVTSLNDEGMKEMNKYAFGGFQVLQECFPEPPHTLSSFLISFYKLFEASSSSNEL